MNVALAFVDTWAVLVLNVILLWCVHREVMSHPVTVFRMKEKVGRIVDILKKEIHNGFPVVDNHDPDQADEVSLFCLVYLCGFEFLHMVECWFVCLI